MQTVKSESFRPRIVPGALLRGILVVAVIFSQSFQLNYSAFPSIRNYLHMGIAMICLNALLIACVNLLLRLLFRRWETVLTITSVLSLLWSIANYYVIEFHGSPLFVSEFLNFRAAAAVAGGYEYKISKVVIGLLLVFAVEVFLIVLLRFPLRRFSAAMYRGRGIILVLLLLSLAAVYAGLLSPISLKPRNTMFLSWYTGVKEYGFVCCSLEDAQKLLIKFQKPEGYQPSAIRVIGEAALPETDDYPDIILVLNETFCDLNCFSHVLDEDLFLPLRETAGLCFGYAAAPGIGGQTNNAEYELFTSNSSKLLAFSSPFSFLSMDQTGSNVISLANHLGYETYGMHCCSGINYSRDTAYPAFGFEHVLFDRQAFPRFSTYGNRPWLDADNYLDMIDYYEAEDESPKLIFLLTFQNHGGYEQNPPEYDTIHTNSDFGNLTDDVDEYLTSVSMSVDAFQELIHYYSHIDRNVVICMVGDHAPSFIGDLPAKTAMTTEEDQIAKRMVPYVIWANYDVKFPGFTEYASMVDIVPMVLQTAGLPLTAYYQYILDMHEVLPIRLSNGIYMDRDGNTGIYGVDSPYYDLMTQYYYMEYNALKAGDEYRRDLFEYSLDR